MRGRAEPTVSEGPSGHRGRWYVLALVAALVLGLVAAVPVFAADQENGEPKVVGGKPVPDGKYRFVASLEARFPEEPGGGPSGPFFQYCGGSLVDRTHVLTAAHCAEFIGGGPGGLPLEDFRVVVGRTVLGGDRGQVRRVDGLRDISIHPRWGPASSNAYDVAVIGLDRPVVGIGPIKPATARQDFLERPGRLATVIGWGNTTSVPPFGGGEVDFPRRLREAEVPVVSDAEAREAYGRVYNPRTMVAAGKKGKDACFGDSGGPLFDTVAGKRYQVGIVSFGYGCARIRFPGVYTEVNAPRVLDFIERNIARN